MNLPPQPVSLVTKPSPPPAGTTPTAPQVLSTKKKLPKLTFIDPQDIENYLSILIVGVQGAGKTRLAASILECSHVEGILYIDVDKGLRSAVHDVRQYQDKLRIIQIDKLDPLGHMKKILDWLEIATDRERAEEEGILFIDTVVIDSISFLSDRAIAKLGGFADAVMLGKDPSKSATQPEWNQQKITIEEWITSLRNMRLNLIVTCHQSSEKNEKLGVIMPTLILPGKLGKKFPAFFDEVLWESVEQAPAPDPKKPTERPAPRRVLLCQPQGPVEEGHKEAKDRSATLPVTLEGRDITMQKLFSYIKAE